MSRWLPGVTAACAGAAALGASLTSGRRRGGCSHHRPNERTACFRKISNGARSPIRGATTAAVYMGNRTLPALSRRVVAEGLPAESPAAPDRGAPRRRSSASFRGTIGDLPAQVAQETIEGPVMLLIGAAIRRAVTVGPKAVSEKDRFGSRRFGSMAGGWPDVAAAASSRRPAEPVGGQQQRPADIFDAIDAAVVAVEEA